MTIRLPRGLAGRPRAALAPSRILQATCTTRYGETPGDDEVASLVDARFGASPRSLAWFATAHRDQPEGTVWKVFLCPARDSRTGRNLRDGEEPGPKLGKTSEVVLPEALWVSRVLERGSRARRTTRSGEGVWVSDWADGMLEFLDGPFPVGSAALGSWLDRDPFEDVPWRAATPEDLVDLADEHPEAQMLSEPVASRRQEGLANRTALWRSLAVVSVAVFLGVVARAPVWWAAARLRSTEARLAEVKPELDRLERLRDQATRDARFLEASAAAFRPGASARPLVAGIAAKLPAGVRLRGLQFDSPPGEMAWRLRTEARLDDWRSVATLVDSLRKVEGVSDVRVETQQREQEKVQLVVSLNGVWP